MKIEKRNRSPRREAIFDIVRNSKQHPTAEAVLVEARKKFPNVSLGTVYRNLNILEEEGRIRVIHNAGGCDRFDGDLEPHIHLTCSHCGTISDLPRSYLDLDLAMLESKTGFRIDSERADFYGICPNCQEKKF